MNVAIAEWMGWTPSQVHGWPSVWRKPLGFHDMVPNYASDLNAMALAENKLTDSEHSRFLDQLCVAIRQKSTQGIYDPIRSAFSLVYACSATASQRAEALCRVICPEKFTA